MNFNSWQFLVFFPIVLLLYWLLPQRFRWIMLLIASYIFYLSWNIWLIFLIMFTTGISYLAGLFIDRTQSTKVKKTWLIFTLVSCLGVLFFFKYFVFLVNTFIDLANLGGANLSEFTFTLILPVGISFYTFQTLSYVIDVYKGRIHAERHLGYYALFVVYFPQLVAGPIERPENLIPQLKAERKFNRDDFFVGMRIALVGFFKKVVIADSVAVYVNAVYNNVAEANGLTALLATILFAIQIYCDFAGYTDIAIGVARMMGIKLMDNFNRPYLATSIKDFWRRWHISLSSWFGDYVYKPMGGSRCKLWRWAINILVVFLLSGLWHGAALTFVVWGGVHAIYQIVGKLKNVALEKLKQKGKIKFHKDNLVTITLKRIVTFALVCFAWIFFRGNSLSDCGVIIAKIFTYWSQSQQALDNIGFDFVALIKIVLMCATLPICYYIIKKENYNDKLLGSNTATMSVGYAFMLIAIVVAWVAFLMTGGAESSFIYFQF